MQQLTPEEKIWADMKSLRNKLKEARGEERNERSRRFAITITEMEKAMAYFYLMLVLEFDE